MRATKESIVIAKAVNTFLYEYMPTQKTKSEYTLKSYEEALTLYIGFLEMELGINEANFCGDCFSSENIEAWLVWLREKRLNSPETCNTRLASLRAFVKYLSKQDVKYLHLSLSASRIERRKTTAPKITGMSKSAIQALLATPDGKTKAGRRDIALMVTMYSTAVRINEILSLKIEHLHLDAVKPYVTVIGKGDKIRTLYLLPKTVAHLRAYLADAHGEKPDFDSYVFYSRNKGLHGKMSQNAVNKQLRKHAATAKVKCPDVPENIHAHQLRHAKASHWFEDGMNIVQISFLLGHAHLHTTMVYLDITTEQEAKALATLEDENDKSAPKKWKGSGYSLAELCGTRILK
jgi:site-specific recombinase XerD